MSDGPIYATGTFEVEFSDPEDARRVHELMQGGLFFQQAVDQLELRPNVHFSLTRTDNGPDGRGASTDHT
ncbi:hypothetical protein A5722_14680 [Mycobacterium vulneris]|nr:hypothetical protein A5722_14680 [Mycolicibacterium vulneris]OCB66175.1 hypothetical protein A5729_12185 [Mycolicibacterium vulneris]